MGTPLVIVESPAKARTISRILGKGYRVEASVGHVRDLPESAAQVPKAFKGKPWARTGVDVDDGYRPLYVLTPRGREQVRKLKELLRDAPVVYLATDEDREGEAIAWHLVETLEPRVPVRRLVFHEITRRAIEEALASPRDLDHDLVQAQETRRVVDRLVGYDVSPILWRKIGPRLSAGRVQSVAVRMVVEREQERMAHVPATWWGLEGEIEARDQRFPATVVAVDGQRLAVGRDFDPRTGRLKEGSDARVLDEAEAHALVEELEGASGRIAQVERKRFTERPPPPFITSTLQQVAARRLRWSPGHTMRVAQRLYENGWITYMRTDSTHLAPEAVRAARTLLQQRYGPDILPARPRTYKTRSRNAQEAHEAIRPAGDVFRPAAECRNAMGEEEARLYELILQRTLACQARDAIGERLTVESEVGRARLRTTGRTWLDPGYRKVFVDEEEAPAEGNARPRKAVAELPRVDVGDPATVVALEAASHTTRPPPRLTEASLIKELEARGIGRPSTYAAILQTIQNRGYVFKKGQALVPTWTAFAVHALMQQHFRPLVDYDFTARLEDDLDAIAAGKRDRLAFLDAFYKRQGEGLVELVRRAGEEADPRSLCAFPIGEADGLPVVVRVGRYGPYLAHGDRTATLPDDLPPDELTTERALELLDRKAEGPRVLGADPETGQPVTLRQGRFGPFVQLGEAPRDRGGERPRRASLLPDMRPEEVDLETALALLSLPRTLGKDEHGEDVKVFNGRYGPYVQAGKRRASLPPGASPLEVTLDEALQVLANPPRRRRGAPTETRTLGEDPEGRTIRLMAGRYGPYVTNGELNASLPKGTDPDTVDLDAAIDLLARRAARGGARPRRRASRRKRS